MTAGPDRNIFWPESIAALGLAAGLCFSGVLWTNVHRTFPVCGIIQCPFSPLCDQLLFCITIIAAICIALNKAKFVSTIVLFVSITLMILLDLNRFQPWLYEYAIIIFLSSLRENKSDESLTEDRAGKLQSISILLVSMYFFSGLQKFNWRFLAFIGPWLLGYSQSPSTSMENNMPAIVSAAVLALGEIATAIALSSKRTRTAGICMALLMHVTILFILGPSRLNHNIAVWPWNVTQMALIAYCFLNIPDDFLFRLSFIKRPITVLTLAIVSLLIPILGLFQITDPYPAFAFYSGDVPCAKLMLSKTTFEQLPFSLRKEYGFYDGNTQLWYVDISDWVYCETGASSYPSKFCFRRMSQKFAADHSGEPVVLKLFTYPKLTKTINSHFEKIGVN